MIQLGAYKDFATKRSEFDRFETFVRFCGKPMELKTTPNGLPMIINGTSSYVDTPMCRWLATQGLSGLLLIATSGPSKTANRWVDRFVHFEPHEWEGEFTFYNLNGVTGDHVKPMPKTNMDPADPKSNREYDNKYGDDWDGFLIRAWKEGVCHYFKKLPNRSLKAKINMVMVNHRNEVDGLMVVTKRRGDDHEYLVKTHAVPGWLRKQQDPLSYIGKDCILNYTQFTPGDRVNNFSSARVIAITK